MAEAIAKKLVAGKAEIRSAGTETINGMQATPTAREALQKRGFDLEPHHSQELTDELIEWADHIFTFTQRRESQILGNFPKASPKTSLLDRDLPINDPIGLSGTHYVLLAFNIEKEVKARFHELGLL